VNSATIVPKVTTIIPTYNQGQYLPFAVESALAQDYENLEIIVSDNHSTDSTPDYLARVSDKRLRVIRPPEHLNMVDNFKFAFSQSKGDYCNFLCSDDILLPGFISKMVKVLDAHPTAAYAHCAAQIIDAEGKVIARERRVTGSYFRKGSEELKRWVQGCSFVLQGVLIRRACYEACGGMRGVTTVGDWVLGLRLAQVGDVVYHDEELVQYRAWDTGERKFRSIFYSLEGIKIYETIIADLLKSRPELTKYAQKGRKARAIGLARDIGRLYGQPQYPELVKKTLRLYDSPEVRLTLGLHDWGLTEGLFAAQKAKLWLRQKVKALLYKS